VTEAKNAASALPAIILW